MRKLFPTLVLTAWAGGLAALSLSPFSDGYAACPAAQLAITITSGPYALVDAKMPGAQGPSIVTLSAIVTNNGPDPATGVTVFIGDGTTPGAFRSIIGKSLSLLGPDSDAQRSLGALEPRQSQSVFWQVFYPANFGVAYPYTIWATGEGDCSGSASATLTTHSSGPSGINKLSPSGATVELTPTRGRVGPGQIVTLKITGFDLGNIGAGVRGEEAAWLQPVGNAHFDPSCFRLIGSEISLKSVSSTPFIDQLYIQGIGSVNPPPNYDNKPNDYALYRFIALRDCTTEILPYQQASTSNDEKYNSDYGQGAQVLVSEKSQGQFALSQLLNPMSAQAGTTLSATIFFSNTGHAPIGDPAGGSPITIVSEAFPDGLRYIAGSSYCSVNCLRFWSTDGGRLFTATEPNDAALVSALKWVLLDPVASQSDPAGTLGFQVVLEREGEICTKVIGRIGESVPVAEDSTCVNSEADLLIEQSGPTNVLPGASFAYVITYGNLGPSTAKDILITDTLPPDTIFLSADPVPDKIAKGETELIFKFQFLPPRQEGTITVRVTASETLTAGTVLPNTVQALMSTPEKNTQNNVSVFAPLVHAPTAPVLRATETVKIAEDVAPAGPSAGDTLEYTATIFNSGTASATAVSFWHPIDPNTRLVSGSINTSKGKVLPDVQAVHISLGTVGPNMTVTISFKLSILKPLPAGVDQISAQGFVFSNELATTVTDDPNTPALQDATRLRLLAAPLVKAYKSFSLVYDDRNNSLSTGDTVEFKVLIVNQGNAAAESVLFTHVLTSMRPAHESVKTTQGTVLPAKPGESTVQVDIGTLAANGGSVTITYRAVIHPLSGGTTHLFSQASVSGSNFPALTTDDPSTPSENDPTAMTVGRNPRPRATLRALLQNDADGNGLPSPGDTLFYELWIVNAGGEAAAGVTFAATPDPRTRLIGGSVGATQGSIAIGNGRDDKSVHVNLGRIAAGEHAAVSFSVTIQASASDELVLLLQGLVTGSNFKNELTDDPTTPVPADATKTVLAKKPAVTVTQRSTLLVDADGDRAPSAGDTLLYTVTVYNAGSAPALGLVYEVTTDPNSSFISESVRTSQGRPANSDTESTARISPHLGDLYPGRTAQISFQAQINNPLASGVTQIVTQGKLSGHNLSTVLSDDPDTPQSEDATITLLGQAQSSIGLASLQATMLDALVSDADGDGVASPGDIIEYTVTITNEGKGEALNLIFTDYPGPNTTLIASSVSTNKGTVAQGNGPNHKFVRVELGRLGPGSSATLSFRVAISSALPPGVFQIYNQGILADLRAPAVLTDDPRTPTPEDPTYTLVGRAPLIRAYQRAAPSDRSEDKALGAGDEIKYTVTIQNAGRGTAQNLVYTGSPDRNTALVPGSVSTSQGKIRLGQSPPDRTVAVGVGSLEPGQTVTIQFTVRLNSPLGFGVRRISMQGRVSGDNFPTTPTDDPDRPGEDQPTVTVLEGVSHVAAHQRARLLIDTDGNGIPGPGDTLLYTVKLTNTGSQKIENLVYDSSLDPNTLVVVGSVMTDIGVVLQGNNSGDTRVQVTVGTLWGGSSARLSFRAMIDPSARTDLISNQGKISDSGAISVMTDDPDTPAVLDPTVTPLGETPEIAAFKTDLLAGDPDGDGGPSPGDPLEYVITIVNHGLRSAQNVIYDDRAAEHTALLAGSIKTTRGEILQGHQEGESEVRVLIGTIPAGGSVHISFRVTIAPELPLGLATLASQGRVLGDNFVPTLTGDPREPTPRAPTVTRLTSFFVTCGDVDGNGLIELMDAMKAAQFALGLASPSPGEEGAADVTVPFGLIDVRDATLIGEIALGVRAGCPGSNPRARHSQVPSGASNTAAAARGATVRLRLEHKRILPGQIETLKLFTQNPVIGLQAGPTGGLRFDPRVLQVREVRGQNGFTVLAYEIDNQQGGVRFLLMALEGVPPDIGPVLELEVEAVGRAGAQSTLTLNLDSVLDAEMREGQAEIENGSVVLAEPENLSVSRILATPSPSRRGAPVQFSAEGQGIKEINVEVFSLSGALILNTGWRANGFSWRLTNAQGQALASGVYLYFVRVRGHDGRHVQSRLQKLVILR